MFVKAFGDSNYIIFEKKTFVEQLKVLALAHVLSLGLMVCALGNWIGRYPFRLRFLPLLNSRLQVYLACFFVFEFPFSIKLAGKIKKLSVKQVCYVKCFVSYALNFVFLIL